MVDTLEIAEFLMARLCHDMAGPVGAINNGVELLKDPNPEFHQESVDLIEISAKEAVARLLYFRQAYGNSKNQAGISMTTIKDLVKNFYETKPISFDWPEAHGDADPIQILSADIVKILLNSIIIVSNSLIHGGKITIRIKNQKNSQAIKVRGEGKSIKLQEHISKTLASDLKETMLDSRNVQAYLTATLAKKIGKLKTDIGEEYLEILVS